MAIRSDERFAQNGHAPEPLGDQFRRSRQQIRDVGSDVAGIIEDVRGLVQKEIELARAEIKEQVGFSTRSLAFGAATAVMAMLLLTFTFLTLMFILDEGMPLWTAALITTGMILALTALCGWLAYSMFKRISVTPKRTIDSVSEDIKWAKRQINFSER